MRRLQASQHPALTQLTCTSPWSCCPAAVT